MPKKVANHARDGGIARLAARQHGVVTTAQLRDAGVLSSGIADRVAGGRLHRVHRGVYAVGHAALSQEGKWMAAVLACGEGAVLSHRSAAAHWGIDRARRHSMAGGRGERAPVDVTVPGDAGRSRRQEIRVHRSGTLDETECTRHGGIPVTTPARTLDDLHRVLEPEQFGAAVREAEFLRLPIGDRFPPDHTRSELEVRLLRVCRRHRLPTPAVNARVEEFVVDFLWRRQRLIVEVDGWESHRTRSAFEADRARDARLKVLGFEVVRFTWRQIASDPAGVARTIRALLSP